MFQLDPDRPPEAAAATRDEALPSDVRPGEHVRGRTTNRLTPSAVIALQRSHGNAYVQRLLAPTQRLQRQEGAAPGTPAPGGTQLQPPTLGGSLGWHPPAPAQSEYQLHLDPEIEAQIRAIEAMRQLVAPEPVVAALRQLPLPPFPSDLLPPPAPDSGAPFPAAGPAAPAPAPAAPAPGPGPRPGTELKGPRPGEAGDIFKAAMSTATIGPAVTRLGELAKEHAWTNLKAPGKAAVVSTSVVLGGSALTAILANPAARSWALTNLLNDRIIPFGIGDYQVHGLSAQFNLSGDNIILGLHLDVGRFLAPLGFGPGSATPLGKAPNPYDPPPGQQRP
jgi:hypothetical protein